MLDPHNSDKAFLVMDPEIADSIVSSIRDGAAMSHAAALVGIEFATARSWVERGEAKGVNVNVCQEIKDFRRRVLKARAEYIVAAGKEFTHAVMMGQTTTKKSYKHSDIVVDVNTGEVLFDPGTRIDRSSLSLTAIAKLIGLDDDDRPRMLAIRKRRSLVDEVIIHRSPEPAAVAELLARRAPREWSPAQLAEVDGDRLLTDGGVADSGVDIDNDDMFDIDNFSPETREMMDRDIKAHQERQANQAQQRQQQQRQIEGGVGSDDDVVEGEVIDDDDVE